MLSVTLTVLRVVSTRYSICIAYETIISPVVILGLRENVYYVYMYALKNRS